MTVVALAGGTGGAKLAHGLQLVVEPGDLAVIVNTGDDTERHGVAARVGDVELWRRRPKRRLLPFGPHRMDVNVAAFANQAVQQ